jgi:hypothetical protein
MSACTRRSRDEPATPTRYSNIGRLYESLAVKTCSRVPERQWSST